MQSSASSATASVKTGGRVLRAWRSVRQPLLVTLSGLTILTVFWAIGRFSADRTRRYPNIEDAFKYGSIGSEPGGSLSHAIGGMLPPRAVFEVLPAICPERLPGGYPSLGLLYERGQSLPIGISTRQRLGFEQVGINCALCHTGSYRAHASAPRQIVAGMPANRLELQRLFRFVIDCILDERFTADNVIGKLEEHGTPLSAVDRALYRLQVVARVRETTLQLERRVGLLIAPGLLEWGPGRVDTFNPYKATQFHFRLDALPRSELMAAANYPSLWNQKPREGLQLHWDGNNTSVDERNLSAALGAGVTPVTVDHDAIARIRAWTWVLPPPRYPFPIDGTVAARGAHIYRRECLSCHGDHRFRDGERVGDRLGKVTPLAQIGTDPQRLNAYTYAFSVNQGTLYPSSRYRFTHFRKTDGYANRPLDGIWLRAPYLHNGSVPSLRALLEPAALRPRAFYRGDDVYDPVNVGFRSDRHHEGTHAFFRFDTTITGNGNAGHDFGTSLADDEKAALVEYMKTL
jgi:hypothetical protein